jgi:hypothetical protein
LVAPRRFCAATFERVGNKQGKEIANVANG